MLTFSGPALSEPFCTALKSLVSSAGSGFTQSEALPDLGAEKCQIIRTLGAANTYHCAWKFEFRSVKAKHAFARTNADVSQCLQTSREVLTDKGVNHPDSYEQRQHKTDNAVISLSIKDKGALQETYVFLSVAGVLK